MRICIIRNGYFPQCGRVRKEVNALNSAGVRVDIVCLRKSSKDKLIEKNEFGNIFRLPFSHHRGNVIVYGCNYFATLFLFFIVLTILYIKNRYDFIQVNTMPDILIFTTAFAKLAGAKVVLDVHEPMPELFETIFGNKFKLIIQFIKWCQRISVRYADACVTVTEELRKKLSESEQGVDYNKILVVRNVCDESFAKYRLESLHQRTDSFHLVMHGLIEERYGHELVVEALSMIRNSIPGITLDITGDGTYINKVLTRARSLSCSDIVTYHGFLPFNDMINILRNADLGIVAVKRSRYSELVDTDKSYEYITMGLPVIASRLPVIANTFSEKNIQFFEPDDAAGLGKAILNLFFDPMKRMAMRNSALSELEAISWQKQKEIYLSLYR